MKITFVVPYPHDIAPGQRFRYEQYLDLLKEKGYEYELLSFLDDKTNQILYKKGHLLLKVWGVLKGYLRRFYHLFKIRNADFVFIYREATPLGFPFVEWTIAKVLRKKIIYDFDDAIWIPATSAQNRLVAWLKYHKKVPLVCKWAYKVSVGNEFLQKKVIQFSGDIAKVILNPTTIDTRNQHNILHQHSSQEKVIIGWTGSHSTLPYLSSLVPVLKELEQEYDFTFRVICNQDPKLPLKKYEFVRWNKKTEIQDLSEISIGVMPLTPDAWSEGKCGFKALQYMALGIPAVVSPVGVNQKIVSPNQEGFWANRPTEWKESLILLLNDSSLRGKMGQKAREKVSKEYSVISNSANFLSLFG